MADSINGVTYQQLIDAGWTPEQIEADPTWAPLLEKDIVDAIIPVGEKSPEPTEEELNFGIEISSEPITLEKIKTKVTFNKPELIVETADAPDNIPIFTKFEKNTIQVEYTVNATGQEDKIIASNRSLKMMHGRSYRVPITNTEINSDTRNIKVFSDIADYIDVRFVKNGFACVTPLRHNITINDGQRLCVLSKEIYTIE